MNSHAIAAARPAAFGVLAFGVLLWVGIAFNAAGVAFIGSRLWKAMKEHARCVTT